MLPNIRWKVIPLISIDITDMTLAELTPEWAQQVLTATIRSHEKGVGKPTSTSTICCTPSMCNCRHFSTAIPYMLEAFMAGDRGFRKGRGEGARPSPDVIGLKG